MFFTSQEIEIVLGIFHVRLWTIIRGVQKIKFVFFQIALIGQAGDRGPHVKERVAPLLGLELVIVWEIMI